MARCPGCGELRWTPLGTPASGKAPCAVCGEPLERERRRPGRRLARRRRSERRDADPRT